MEIFFGFKIFSKNIINSLVWFYDISTIVGNLMQNTSSSCCAASMDIPDPLSPLLPIIHRLWQVFRVTSCVLT